jgi:hypothetical protein
MRGIKGLIWETSVLDAEEVMMTFFDHVYRFRVAANRDRFWFLISPPPPPPTFPFIPYSMHFQRSVIPILTCMCRVFVSVDTPSLTAKSSCPLLTAVKSLCPKVFSGSWSLEKSPPRSKSRLCPLTGLLALPSLHTLRTSLTVAPTPSTP